MECARIAVRVCVYVCVCVCPRVWVPRKWSQRNEKQGERSYDKRGRRELGVSVSSGNILRVCVCVCVSLSLFPVLSFRFTQTHSHSHALHNTLCEATCALELDSPRPPFAILANISTPCRFSSQLHHSHQATVGFSFFPSSLLSRRILELGLVCVVR